MGSLLFMGSSCRPIIIVRRNPDFDPLGLDLSSIQKVILLDASSLRLQRLQFCAIPVDSSPVVPRMTTLVFVLPQKVLVVLRSMQIRVKLIL